MTRAREWIAIVIVTVGLTGCGGGDSSNDAQVVPGSGGAGGNGGMTGTGGMGAGGVSAGGVGGPFSADARDTHTAAGGAVTVDAPSTNGGSGGTGIDAGLADTRETKDQASKNDTVMLDTPSDGTTADASKDTPVAVHGLDPIRTFAYHELTSLPTEPQNWPVVSKNGLVVAFTTSTLNNKEVVVHVVNADGTGQKEIDRFTPLCYCTGTVAVSADGQHIVSTESMQIRHTALSGATNPVLSLDSNEIVDIRITSDGTRIFFLVRRDVRIAGTSTNLERGVYLVNTDGTGLRQVTGPTTMAVGLGVAPSKIFPFSGCSRSMDISSDGSRIAFAANVDGMERVFSVNADGSQVRKLVDASGGFKLVEKMALSGDGRLVAYHVYVGDGKIEMGVIGFDGTGRRMLDTEPPAPLAGCSGNIRFTEDGSKLYVDEPSYLYNTDGSGILQLSMGVIKPPGGSPVKDGTFKGWMNADGTRFVYKNVDDRNIPQVMLLEVNPASLGAAPSLSGPTFTPGTVTVAGLNSATATVQASGTGIKTVGVSFAINGLPDVIDRGPGVVFGDGGKNGDAIAGDGVWSGKGFYGYSTPKPGPRSVRFTAEASVAGKRHATVLEAGMVTVE